MSYYPQGYYPNGFWPQGFLPLQAGSIGNQVATPSALPTGGVFSSALTVALSCATASATIIYTTDGSNPVTSPTAAVYDGNPIIVAQTTTIRAYATKVAMTDSSPMTPQTYTITTPPIVGSSVQYVALPLTVNNLSTVNLKEGDTAPSRCVQLVDAQNRPIILSQFAVILYKLRVRGGSVVSVEGYASILSAMLGVVRYDFTAALPASGNYEEEWTVTDGGTVITFPTSGFIPVKITGVLN